MWNDFSDFYDFFYIEVVNKPKIKEELAKHTVFSNHNNKLYWGLKKVIEGGNWIVQYV